MSTHPFFAVRNNSRTVAAVASLLVALPAAALDAPASAAIVTPDAVPEAPPAPDCRPVRLFTSADDLDTGNRCPVAVAGADRTASVGEVVFLDAAGSTDLDGERLSFSWSLVHAPEGSGAELTDADTPRARFSVDLLGTYMARVEISDESGAIASDTVVIQTDNSNPTANAGSGLRAALGETVLLDGSRSGDPDGDSLRYHWSIAHAPAGSMATLLEPRTVTPAFSPDQPGDYVLRLIVSDGDKRSDPDFVRLSTRNVRPVAATGGKLRAAPGEPTPLAGGDSLDADGDPLAFSWSVLYAPADSNATIQPGDTPEPLFEADIEGMYLVQLVVNDGLEDGEPATLVVEVRKETPRPMTVQDILDRYPEMGASDVDGDGVADIDDNCLNVANADQRDTDADGIGNICDPDLDNDGAVNFVDLGILKSLIFTNDPDADLDGDGFVNFIDLGIMKSLFFSPPGPPGTLTWVNAAGGVWNDIDSWSPRTLPAAGVTCIIDLDPDVTVSINSGVVAEAGNVLLGDVLTMNGGTLRGATVMPAIASGEMTATSLDGSLDSVTLDVPLTMADGAVLNVQNDLTTNSQIIVQSTSTGTGLDFNSNSAQSLLGTGEVFFDSPGNSVPSEPRIRPVGSSSLTVGPDITVRGGNGSVGISSLVTNVLGTIIADGAIIQYEGVTRTATGTLSAINGGTISIRGTIDNAGLPLALDAAGGTAIFEVNPSLNNLTINGTPGTTIIVPSTDARLGAAIVNADMFLENGAVVTVTNNLTLNGTATINAPSSPSGFDFSNNPQTFDGTALVIFDSAGNSVVTEAAVRPIGNAVLTIGADVDFQGGNGTVGVSSLSTTVLGDVTASAGSTIRITGVDASATGTLSAEAGGTIEFNGTFDNGGATVDLDAPDGDVVMVASPTLSNMNIDATAGTLITVPSTDARFNSVDVTADILIENGGVVTLTGGLTLNGTATITAPSSPSGFDFSNDAQTFDGNALVVFDSAANSVITEATVRPVGNGVLTIGPNVDFRGGNASIGVSSLTTSIAGDVDADVAGTGIRLTGVNWSATGTLRATNGANIELNGSWDNAGQSVTLDAADGTVTTVANPTLRDVTINGTAGTVIDVASTDARFDGVTLTGDLALENGAVVTVTDGLTLNGTATITAPSSPTGFDFSNDAQTFGGTAQVVFDAAGNSVVTEPAVRPIGNAVLTIGPNVDFSGGNGTIGVSSLTTHIQGDVNANVLDTRIKLTGVNWTATSALTASNGGILEFEGTMDNNGAAVALDVADGRAILDVSAILREVVINGTPGSLIEASSSVNTFDGITLNADLRIPDNGEITVTDNLTLNGTATIASTSSPTGINFSNNPQTLGGTGEVVFDGTNTVLTEVFVRGIGNAEVTIGSNITVRGDFGTVGLSSRPLVNAGTILASGAGTLIDVTGTTVTNNGVMRADDDGVMNVNNLGATGGTLQAFGGGTIALLDPLTLSGGLVEIGIGGALPGEFGVVSTTGAADLDLGTLDLTLTGGFSPSVGQLFTIMPYGSLLSAFGTVNGTNLGGGQSFQLNYNVNDLTLQVVGL